VAPAPKVARAKALPRALDQLAEYNTIILGDVSSKLVDSAFLDLLGKAVRERGVGLIVAAGPLHMPHVTTLACTICCRSAQKGVPGRYPRGIPSFRIDSRRKGRSTRRCASTTMPAATASPGQSAALLLERGSRAPVSGRHGTGVEPHRDVLRKVPLIAHQYAGRGRVMFVGTDSTWLWRQNVGDRFFYRFWGQATRFTARREEKSSKKSWIEVRPVRAQPGEQAEIELMAFAPSGAPLTDAKQTVQVTSDGAPSDVELQADPTSRGDIRASSRRPPRASIG